MLEMILLAMLAEGNPGNAAPLGQAKIGQVAMTVTDLARARDFYATTLGLTQVIQTDTMLFFDIGGTMLMFALPEEKVRFSAEGAVVYFSVDDIRARWKALRARGVDFLDEPHEVHRANDRTLWLTFFRDPDGHLLALMSWQ